jgi:glycosyltransferase involved in cell wall biosynthesis
MLDNEKVNIIIATHNDSTTIQKTLESVTKGIRPADQVTVGDNNSTDGTYDVLCKLLDAKQVTIDNKTGLPPQFKGKFNEIPVTIFRKKSSTIGHTLNIAMQMEWKNITLFGFVDKGSWYAGDKIAQAIRVFQQYPAVACVVSDFDNHHSDGRVERVFRCSFDMQRLLTDYQYDRNFLVRTQIFPKLKCGFSEQMPIRDDYDLLLKISEIGLIYHIPAPLHNNIIVEIDETVKQLITQNETITKQLTAQRRNKPNG